MKFCENIKMLSGTEDWNTKIWNKGYKKLRVISIFNYPINCKSVTEYQVFKENFETICKLQKANPIAKCDKKGR